MSKHLGDFDASTVVYGKFSTFRPSTGATFTLGGTPALSVYKDNSVTQSTTGVTLTADFDAVTGLNHFAIDTSADGTFYAAGSFFDVVITTGTVDSVSVTGSVVASFTLRKNSALKPTTAGRALDVSADGEAGIDWANVGSPTTAVNLSATNIDVDQIVASVSGAVGSVSGAVGSVTGLTASNLDVAVSTLATQTSVNTIDDLLDTEITDIRNRLPAALTAGGNMKCDALAISGSTTAADNLEGGGLGLVVSTCATGSTTTSIVTNLTEATDDHYNGRVITFTTGALLGQTTSISDYNGTTKTLTVVALTEAAANTDGFVIS